MFNDPLITSERVFARNCRVERIEAEVARRFLDANHRFGAAVCRYWYGLYQRRTTGAAENDHSGALVAVAGFSAARRWLKGDKTVRSYEWVRYASLDGLRVVGGMGKLLGAFVEEVRPDDVMTYALTGEDMAGGRAMRAGGEFDGGAFRRLGFVEEGEKVFGDARDIKFRLKLTDW